MLAAAHRFSGPQYLTALAQGRGEPLWVPYRGQPARPSGPGNTPSGPDYSPRPFLLPIRLWSHRHRRSCRPTRLAARVGENIERLRVADRAAVPAWIQFERAQRRSVEAHTTSRSTRLVAIHGERFREDRRTTAPRPRQNRPKQ